MTIAFTIKPASWAKDRSDLIRIRTEVFINEQHVPPDLEWDGYDPDCWHVIARNAKGEAIGTARMLYDGHIGRMAVLSPYRHQGVGSALLRALLQYAQQAGIHEVFLHAQTSAIKFYRQHGFSISSDEFMDAGIPHRSMRKILDE